jgi:hypothetical protein
VPLQRQAYERYNVSRLPPNALSIVVRPAKGQSQLHSLETHPHMHLPTCNLNCIPKEATSHASSGMQPQTAFNGQAASHASPDMQPQLHSQMGSLTCILEMHPQLHSHVGGPTCISRHATSTAFLNRQRHVLLEMHLQLHSQRGSLMCILEMQHSLIGSLTSILKLHPQLLRWQ